MRALHLDYQRVYRPVPWLGLCVLLVALLALAGLGWHYLSLSEQIRAWESQVAHIERQAQHRTLLTRPLTEQASRAQRLEVEQANQVLRQLSQSWGALFEAVDTSGEQGIALLSLEPDPKKGTVQISGEARDFKALLAYAKQLSTREVFGHVMLQSHQIKQDDPQKPVRFSLLVDWKEATP